MATGTDQDTIDAVTAKFQRGDLAGAGADCNAFFARVSDPARQAPLRFWRGAVAQRSGDLPTAVEQFEIALKANRRHPPWLMQAGLAHYLSNSLERAEYLYREALRLEPRFPLAHYNLGILLQKTRNWTGARRAFEAAIALQPQFTEALVNLANTLVEQSEFDAAEGCYRRALAVNPGFANALHGLALHHVRRREHHLAIPHLELAVEREPAHLDAWLALAGCRHESGDTIRALQCLEQILMRDPTHEIALFKQAQFGGRTPNAMPLQLVDQLHAGMANDFDDHLTKRLGYRIPEQLVEALSPWLKAFAHRHSRKPNILDLGCGTGLFGLAARELASTLTGVDLSAVMLDTARERGVYEQLVESDLLTFLKHDDRKADLIAATDVLIYVGQLEPLFEQIPSHLNPAGIFAFSTEFPPDMTEDFRLEASGRYAHHPQYIARLAESAGLSVNKRIDTVVRTENAVPLAGQIFILEKN